MKRDGCETKREDMTKGGEKWKMTWGRGGCRKERRGQQEELSKRNKRRESGKDM